MGGVVRDGFSWVVDVLGSLASELVLERFRRGIAVHLTGVLAGTAFVLVLVTVGLVEVVFTTVIILSLFKGFTKGNMARVVACPWWSFAGADGAAGGSGFIDVSFGLGPLPALL